MEADSACAVSSLALHSFRQFTQVEFQPISAQQVIMGGNGCGKTSILWAIVFLLRAYNCRAENTNYRDKDDIAIMPSEMAQLLNYPGLSDVNSHEYFNNQPKKPVMLEATICNRLFKCTLLPNGKITLQPAKFDVTEQKVGFAFVAPDTHFTGPGSELDTPILSSIAGKTRKHYKRLAEIYKRELQDCMKQVFPEMGSLESYQNQVLHKIISKHDGVSDIVIEIMFEGTAFRKVFVTLVYLFKLVSSKYTNRVMLVEEPEAHLYPTLQNNFLEILFSVTTKYKIQLIMVTNCPSVLGMQPPENIVVLRKQQVPQRLSVSLNLQDMVELNILGLPGDARIPIVIVEGIHDRLFLVQMAKIFNVSGQIVIHEPPAQHSTLTYAISLARVLKSVNPNYNIRLLQDKDFLVGKPEIIPYVEIIVWDLPCIESYLFLDFWMNKDIKKNCTLNELFEGNLASVLAKAYMDGYKSQNGKNGDSALMFEQWTNAKLAAQQWDPVNPDIVLLLRVVKVIHGHTWTGIMNISTPSLINNLSDQIRDFAPANTLLILQRIYRGI